jgi:hypothetical protein
MFFKKNKYMIVLMVILTIIMIVSFYQFYRENFSYSKAYYQIEENCLNKKNESDELCSRFKTKKQLTEYLSINDPLKKYQELDAITLTCNIVETTMFSMLQFLSPLLIIFALVFSVQPELNSGFLKNILMREEYKEYKKKILKRIVIISFSTPLILFIIFLIANIITKFNYKLPSDISRYAVYNQWKYNNFVIYGLIVSIIQFFINIFYCCIGLYSCLKNKNSIVSTIMGYILFLILDLFIYVVIYACIINKLLGFKNLTDYFNITGYWFFNDGPSCAYIILISFIIQFLAVVLMKKIYQNKERIIINYESQNA